MKYTYIYISVYFIYLYIFFHSIFIWHILKLYTVFEFFDFSSASFSLLLNPSRMFFSSVFVFFSSLTSFWNCLIFLSLKFSLYSRKWIWKAIQKHSVQFLKAAGGGEEQTSVLFVCFFSTVQYLFAFIFVNWETTVSLSIKKDHWDLMWLILPHCS